MSWINVQSYLGFQKPYKMERAVLVLLAGWLLISVLILTVLSLVLGLMSIGTARFYFSVYLILLLLGSVSLVRFHFVSRCLVGLALLEILIATVTHFAPVFHLKVDDLWPENIKISSSVNAFKFHPLLGGIPNETYAPRGLSIHHNHSNMRGEEIALRKDQVLINVYGGSSTYDLGVPDGESWVEQVEKRLGSHYVLANFGVPGYSTVEHIIQTALYEDKLGRLPRCAVYYVGWNDIRNAHLPNLDPGYADYHLLSKLSSLRVRNYGGVSITPLYYILSRELNSYYDTIPISPEYWKLTTTTGQDANLEYLFERNIKTLVAINQSRGVRTVFIDQVLNKEKLEQSDGRYGWLPRVKDRDVWPLQERFNQVLKKTAVQLGAGFIHVDQAAFHDADFVDQGHFSPQGSKKFAEAVSGSIGAYCR